MEGTLLHIVMMAKSGRAAKALVSRTAVNTSSKVLSLVHAARASTLHTLIGRQDTLLHIGRHSVLYCDDGQVREARECAGVAHCGEHKLQGFESRARDQGVHTAHAGRRQPEVGQGLEVR